MDKIEKLESQLNSLIEVAISTYKGIDSTDFRNINRMEAQIEAYMNVKYMIENINKEVNHED